MNDIAEVPRFGVYEQSFRTRGQYANPYVQMDARATLTRPDGARWAIPLFWDGETEWKVRVSPDLVGTWSYQIQSDDSGLNGQTGSFACAESSLRGGIMPMGASPYHFQHQDGTPFWLLGDTGWRCFADNEEKKLNRETVCHYFDVRGAQGFNYIHVDMMGGGGIDSEQKVFVDMANEVINPAFFQEVDHRVRHMNERGITCGMVLGWMQGNPSLGALSSDSARLRYARYVVARYSAYNVLILAAGEWDQTGVDKKPTCQALGREIMSHDPHDRMRAIHPCGKRTVEEFAFEDWISFSDYQQLYEAPDRREATPAERDALRNALLRAKRHRKPVVNSEYAYFLRQMGGDHSYHKKPVDGVDKPHSHTRDSFRRASWALAMAGGYFVTGFGSTYFGGWRDLGPFNVDDPRYDEAEQDLVNIKAFFTSLEWWRLEVADPLVTGQKDSFSYCLADIGKTYVVYTEGNRSVSLDLGGAPVRKCSARRFDPRTGSYEDLPQHLGTGPVSLATSSPEDWVFVVNVLA